MKEGNSKMRIISASFGDGEEIPAEFTCDGEGVSPQIEIDEVPEEAKSLVFIMDDPDSPTGTWDHWVVFNISPKLRTIGKGQEPDGLKGKNSWGKTGYGGPCPGRGSHRYFFKVYALDIMLDLPEGSSKKEIEGVMVGYIVASAELMGRYERLN